MSHSNFVCQVEDLATPYLRGEAELRGEGRDCLEPVRRRMNPTTTSRNGNAPRGCVTKLARFERTARAMREELGEASPENLNRMLQLHGFGEE